MYNNKHVIVAAWACLTLSGILLKPASASSPSSSSQETYMGRRVSKTLQFLSPLQSLTIFPKDVSTTTPRDEFLPKFQAGLEAEKKAKEYLMNRQRAITATQEEEDDVVVGKGWEKKSEERERIQSEQDDQFIERAHDQAVLKAASSSASSSASGSSTQLSKYQFVGVVQPPNSDQKVKWYARKRPTNSKWNVRLLHANRDVILRDLFVNGKVDVFAKYTNTGDRRDPLKEGEDPSAPHRPLIEAEYKVKKRGPWNLWNFSPKHFFTDSSGAFWRERRLSPGLYTDGSLVYESKYRYSDGKNGMKPISRLDALLGSKAIKDDVKTKILDRLEKDTPDVVIEE